MTLSHRRGRSLGASAPAISGTGSGETRSIATAAPQPCTAALNFQKAEGGYTANQIASAYQLSPLYEAGNFGAGQTVALLEMEPFLASDIATYQSCYGTDAKVTAVDVQGGPGPYVNEDNESSLDIEQVLGLAPGADLVVYQGPNPSEVELISAYVEENVAKVMSSSWGICEPEAEKSELAAIGTLLQEAAAQGQSFFVAAGDDGSTDCYTGEGSNESISVDSPGSQPFATDVGGTRMEAASTPPVEYIWNSGPGGGAGGGGVSEQFPMPAYQAEAKPSVGVIGPLSSGATCGFAGYCRQVPDVSADAAAATGYIVFSEESWQLAGGTSASAPLWAAFVALANASPSCKEIPIGFANPALYEIAGDAYAANFHDITAAGPHGFPSNDMLNSGVGPFPVGPGYDMATGIGTPVGASLAASLCARAAAHEVSVINPGSQSTILGGQVGLQIVATRSGGTPLTFAASGLPEGLAINPKTGVIYGSPSAPGTTTVTVSARDELGNEGSASFGWTVTTTLKRRLTRAAISGIAKGRPKLTFALAARPRRSLRAVTVKLPRGLTVTHSPAALAKGVAVATKGHGQPRAKSRTYARSVVIGLPRPLPAGRFTVAAPAIGAGAKLMTWVKHHPEGRLKLVVIADETGPGGSRYPLTLTRR